MTTLSDSAAAQPEVSKEEYEYDGNNNRTLTREHGFGAGAPGGLLRQTAVAYKTDPGYPEAHLLSLPERETVKDAAGVRKAETTYTYDGAAPDACAKMIEYEAPPAVRGNPATVSRWLYDPLTGEQLAPASAGRTLRVRPSTVLATPSR